MVWFFKKRKEVVDLSSMEKSGLMARSREIARIKKIESAKSGDVLDLTKLNMDSASTSNESALGFLGSFAESASREAQPMQIATLSSSQEEVKSKLAKRLIGMTEKMEQQDKEIYTLQQRIELLERRLEKYQGKGME